MTRRRLGRFLSVEAVEVPRRLCRVTENAPPVQALPASWIAQVSLRGAAELITGSVVVVRGDDRARRSAGRSTSGRSRLDSAPSQLFCDRKVS